MPHEHETLDTEPATTTANPPTAAEPDFVTRARRIFSGDIRPDDYLTVPPEVQAATDRALAASPGYEPYWKDMLNDWTLSYLYGGTGSVAYRFTEHGVLVFAVGLEQIRELLDQFPRDEQRAGFTLGPPMPWQSISSLNS